MKLLSFLFFGTLVAAEQMRVSTSASTNPNVKGNGDISNVSFKNSGTTSNAQPAGLTGGTSNSNVKGTGDQSKDIFKNTSGNTSGTTSNAQPAGLTGGTSNSNVKGTGDQSKDIFKNTGGKSNPDVKDDDDQSKDIFKNTSGNTSGNRKNDAQPTSYTGASGTSTGANTQVMPDSTGKSVKEGQITKSGADDQSKDIFKNTGATTSGATTGNRKNDGTPRALRG
ncbi:hypothetical protein SDRG_00248 [Saprolegnia diclina VS20]|uniref:Uncharacterized protein n=1 Tax=Saprolegnia diclina (strain VS20) TaxID=1156394 RepID=T0R7T2_SAPDV|nr:hypothetical protein SDRG_00248 [Saprolegnia diclina VS20]EQC42515.1 hypothetical protein SDRG_00248 [Saprolegnia diclina VS20]|eukprot:XP_008603938.1 hypothetical protein SDRG_00248 [Saprolegnia diclina VS20]